LTAAGQQASYQPVLTTQATPIDDVILRALADPLRARIVWLLATEQMCTCHLVEETGAGQPNVSNHLRVLREAGVIVSEPCGRYTYHRLVTEPLEALATALGQTAARARLAVTTRRPCG
jgi:ArsR family transcriptional regulator